MPVPVTPTGRRPRRLLRDLTFDTVLGAIVDGTLAPDERLFEDDIAVWLGVSKTPVKEALSRLADQGLVEIEANRYTKVSSASTRDLMDVLEMVGLLHGSAIRGAADLEASNTADVHEAADHLASIAEGRPRFVDLIEGSRSFLALSENPLAQRAAAPLDNRAVFLSRHVALDLSSPSARLLLDRLGAALRRRRWAEAAHRYTDLFSRHSLASLLLVTDADPGSRHLMRRGIPT
ncbi:GntR family transcriptional regulator [Frigoribacterium sp. 2-23]|uniref:GntR family transcriptional regulator n=1 Tax=Frigoribacterium sp. 2-23 TaxID=3415006 RepID=UPI003C6ED510